VLIAAAVLIISATLSYYLQPIPPAFGQSAASITTQGTSNKAVK